MAHKTSYEDLVDEVAQMSDEQLDDAISNLESRMNKLIASSLPYPRYAIDMYQLATWLESQGIPFAGKDIKVSIEPLWHSRDLYRGIVRLIPHHGWVVCDDWLSVFNERFGEQ